MNKKRYSEKAKKLSIYLRKAVICLAVFVVFITSYMMTLPAITVSKETAADDPAIVLDTETPETEENQEMETVYDPFSVEEEREEELKQQTATETENNAGASANSNISDNEKDVPEIDESRLPEDTAEAEPLYFYDDSTDVAVLIEAPYGAFPEGTEMTITSIEYHDIQDSVMEAVDGFSYVQAIDITFYHDGKAVEPALPIKVSFVSEAIKEADESVVLHIGNEGQTDVIELSEEETEEDVLVFESQDFSTYVIVYTQIEKTFISADGETYKITVTYDDKAQIPDDATLEVEEILPDSETYEDYYSRTESVLNPDEEAVFVRFFDISIISNGSKIQPQSAVQVKIEIDEEVLNEVKAYHFKEEEVEPIAAELAENESKNLESAIVFSADGFSVYAIAETKSYEAVTAISDLDGNGYYVCIDNSDGRYYFKNTVASNRISKTNASEISAASLYYFELIEGSENRYNVYTYNPDGDKVYLNSSNGNFSFSANTKSEYRVEQHTEEGTFFIYYQNGSKKYSWFYNNTGFSGSTSGKVSKNKVVLIKEGGNDPFELDGKSFGILNNNNTVSGKALMTAGNDGSTNLSSKELVVRTDVVGREKNVFVAANSDIVMWFFSNIDGDQYYITTEIDGELKYLSISSSGLKLVGDDEIDDNCRIRVEEGTGKYTGKYKFATVTSEGGRTYNNVMKLNGSVFDRGDEANNDSVWMNLAVLSTLKDDDFVVYTATKVSVSYSGEVTDHPTSENSIQIGEGMYVDYDVNDGDEIVLYTRYWNQESKRYEYFVIDYDGVMVKAYESGDTISWVGSKVNTMLWDFTEYYYEGTHTPNYYYELQNTYSGKYVAPQVTGSNILSNNKIGINLNGRRNGQYYSTVLAWDDPYYDYASLKASEGKLISAPLAKADTFYFAVMKPVATTEGKLTTAETIDHETFGITVKMQDYERINSSNRSQEQIDVLGNTAYYQWTGTKNLLKRNLESNGYPLTNASVTGKPEQSLYELYDNALEVNQQFLLSTYNETGYFEYDSTQNFAHLISSTNDKWYGRDNGYGGTYDVGDFVVYDQLGTSDEGNKDTLKHGQFFPYNDITQGFDEDGNPIPVGISTKYKNDMDIHANPLSSLDPRKGEALYNIPFKQGQTAPNYVDHFFGVEMSASFMQNESGLDAWGHDLIFEFSGDDDFWFYVDDVLILDLGGIHSAIDGSINFKTGEVKETAGSPNPTNLRTKFKLAYEEKNPKPADMSDDAYTAQVNAYLNEIFIDNGSNTGTVFKNYSGHTMKMFYMERGAGASNLHMRFNLAPYTDGEVLLEKEVTGVESIDPDILFPFQIWYEDISSGVMRRAGQVESQPVSVTDVQTGQDIPYQESYTLTVYDGDTPHTITYNDVYFLSANQVATILLPDEDTKYLIQECAIDTIMYDTVTANDNWHTGDDGHGHRFEDYRILPQYYDGELYFYDFDHLPDQADLLGTSHLKDRVVTDTTVAGRKKVIYYNHVSENAVNSLFITKKLWKDDQKQERLTDDTTGFQFRVYIGKNNESYMIYNTGLYYVLGPDGCYCIYENGQFKSTHKDDISLLDNDESQLPPDEWKTEYQKACFYTSPSGAIDKIQDGYTVEIPKLMDGTAFLVEEREGEIPAGYHFIDYERDPGAEELYPQELDENRPTDLNAGNLWNRDAKVIVNNQHGYGLSLVKVWSDADFMQDHDPIYFAVYLKTDTDGIGYEWGDPVSLLDPTEDDPDHHSNFVLLEDSIRQLGRIETKLKWFYSELNEEKTLNDYRIYEVLLKGNYTVTNGIVALEEGCTVKPVEENGSVTVGGTTNEHGYSTTFDYTVNYSREMLTSEQIDQGVNNRTDTTKNSRPGLKLIKTNLGGRDGSRLEGGVFTMRRSGDASSQKRFISDENGLIAVAYLTIGEEYVLAEIGAPFKHKRLLESITIKVELENEKTIVYVNGERFNGTYYQIDQEPYPTAVDMPAIYIMNEPTAFKAVKVDAINGLAIENVEFALYQEVYEYETEFPMPDYTPMEGFAELITDEEGVIPKIDLDHLTTGTYYLREVGTPLTHNPLDFDIRLTIKPSGDLVIEKAVYSESQSKWVFSDITDGTVTTLPDENGNITIRIENRPTKGIRILKKSDLTQEPLPGATFELYKANQVEEGKPKEGESPLLTATSGSDGLFNIGVLNKGTTYYLFETVVPDGYILPSAPIIISTTLTGNLSASQNGTPLTIEIITLEDEDVDIYQITAFNSTGYELPASGGVGRSVFYIAGACLIAVAVLLQKRTK